MTTHKSIAEMELNTFKDSIWRLTNRVYIIENFIKQKFGDVLLCVDVPVKENTSVIKQGSTLRRKAKSRSSVKSKNKRAKQIANSVDSDEGSSDEDSTSGTDDSLLNCDAPPVKESASLTTKVRISPKRKTRRKSPRNLAKKMASGILKSESTKIEKNATENSTSEIEIKEEYLYLSDDSNEAEGDERQSGSDPDFIVNQKSHDTDPDYEVNAENVHKKREKHLWKKISPVSEDILQNEWRKRYCQKSTVLPEISSVYYYCKVGGKRCPVFLKQETIPGVAVDFYTNGREHCHSEASGKTGLTHQQKSVIQELLSENKKINPKYILKVFESRSLDVPPNSKLKSYMHYARSKLNVVQTPESNTSKP